MPCIVANPDTTAQGNGRCVVALPRQFASALATTMANPPTGTLASCMVSLGHLRPPAARQAIKPALLSLVMNPSLQRACSGPAHCARRHLHGNFMLNGFTLHLSTSESLGLEFLMSGGVGLALVIALALPLLQIVW